MADSRQTEAPVNDAGRLSRMFWQYGMPLLPFVLLVAILALGLGRDPSLVPSPFVNKSLPEFTAPRLGAETEDVAINKAMEGKVWMLNVWASWCAPCLQEHPQITWLAGQGLPVVGLNYKDKKEDALSWLERHGDPFGFSLVDREGSIGIDLGVYGVPESFVVDASGTVVHKHVGPIFADDAQGILDIAADAGLATRQ